jgi:D-alanyl-lipoteichoic acid acyltransferase DltB (MBOAT superfamily)
MVFTSFTFLGFAAIFFPIFFLTRGRVQTLVCVIGSYVFYGWWDWRFMALLATSTTVDYTLGRCIAASTDPRRRQLWVGASVVMNLGFLGFFKYFNFFAGSFADMARSLGFVADWATLHIVLPVGISFYTFQSMSYTIDVYRRRIAPERDFLVFAAFIALFPQLVAGPIVRASWLLPQMHTSKRFNWANLFSGFEMIVLGFFMKLVVADNLAPFVAENFAFPEAHNSLSLLLSVIFFAFQIYGDFAGYSLIAIGLARIMGYRFCRNFRRPYLAASFSEFWTRWHISLSSWLRDYLYISLGGNRHGTLLTYRNLLLTMLLGGLWHGANWTFIIWGALHGSYLVMQRVLGALQQRLALPALLPPWAARALAVLVVFSLTALAWIFFRAENTAQAWTVIERILFLGDFRFDQIKLKFEAIKGIMLILLLIAIELLGEPQPLKRSYMALRPLRTAAVLCLLWLIPFAGSFSGAQFIYFQF